MVPEKTLLIIKEKPRIYCISALGLGIFSKCWEFGGTAGSIYAVGAFLDLWLRALKGRVFCLGCRPGTGSGHLGRKPGMRVEAGGASAGSSY
jgi:hypothetical protein